MSNNFIDILNNIIVYGNNEIFIIIDNNNIPWFSAKSVALALGYKKTDDAIRTNTDFRDRTKFKNLKKFVKNVPLNMQPRATFINESGLYSLAISSRLPSAKEFKHWITSSVLPQIRKTGNFSIESNLLKELQQTNKKLNQVNSKLKDSKKQIRVLKHNQKKTKYKKGGVVYIMRPISEPNTKLHKPGSTFDLNKRLDVMETSIGDKMDVLFTLYTDEPREVEDCVKLLMRKYIYRGSKKEYYETTVSKLETIINKCHHLIKDETYCDDCQCNIDNDIMSHIINDHDIDKNEILYVEIVEDDYQKGGSEHLFEIPIENPLIIEKFCQIYFHPFIVDNYCYYQCKINQIKHLLESCKQSVDNFDINQFLTDHQLDPNEHILIDIPLMEQYGGAPQLSSEEFGKRIVVIDDAMILPNGVVLYHNGQVVNPNQKPKSYVADATTQTGGSINNLQQSNYQSQTFSWLNY